MPKLSHVPSRTVKRLPELPELPTRKILEASRVLRAGYMRKYGWRVDLDDVQQDAALVGVETVRRYKLRKGNPFNFIYTAAVRRVALSQVRALSPFSISERGVRDRKVAALRRITIGDDSEHTPFEPPGGAMPDARLDALEAEQEETRRRLQLRKRLELAVAQCEPRDRAAAEMLLGLNDEGSEQREVSWRTGLSPSRVAVIVKKLTAVLRTDAEACRLRGVISAPAQ